MIEDVDLLEDIIHNLAYQIRTLSNHHSLTDSQLQTLSTLKKDLRIYQKQYASEMSKHQPAESTSRPTRKSDF